MKKLRMLFVAVFGGISAITFAGENEFTPSTSTELELFNSPSKDISTGGPNRRKQHPFGINLIGFGPGGLASASIDYFVTPKVAIEGGIGFRNEVGDIGYFLGGRYHIFGNTFLNLTPYIGAYTSFHYNQGHENSIDGLQNHGFYMPFGLHKIKRSGFNWAVEVAYEKNTFKDDHLAFGFRLGYRF